uniref:Uncharacterized protein n=1 Tax=Acrobeloides nanus TaxID=290746 RepID=A0A914CQ41_9BILA
MDDFKFVSVEKKSALLSFYNEFGEDYQLTPVESLDKLATGHICSILIELKTDKKKKFVFPTRFAYEGIGMYLVQRKTDHQAYLDQLKCTSAVHGDEKEITKFLVVLLHLFNEKHPARISHVINQLSTEAQKEIHDILKNFDISKKSDAFNVLYVSARSGTNFTGLSDNHQIYKESIKGQEGNEITEEARLEKSSQLVDSDISNGCGSMVSDESSYMETNSDEV